MGIQVKSPEDKIKMAFVRSVILLVLVAVAHAAVPTKTFLAPTAVLDCREDSFRFNFTLKQTSGSNYAQKVSWSYGAKDQSTAACKSSANEVVDHTVDTTGSAVVSEYGDATTPICNGNWINETDSFTYSNKFFVQINETERGAIERIYLYTWTFNCTLERNANASDSIGFKVKTGNADLEVDANTNKSEKFTLDVSLDLWDTGSDAKINSQQDLKNNDQVDFKVYETTDNDDFRFTVQKCHATQDSNSGNDLQQSFDDTFLEDGCGVDSSVVEPTQADADTNDDYVYSVRAFYIKDRPTDPVYIHCEIYICIATESNDAHDGKCTPQSRDTCVSKKRKRRSVEEEDFTRTMTVTSKQGFVLTDVYSPRCPSEYVYDTLTDDCTNDRLLLIKGVHLDLMWKSSYTNSSSTEFKQFADITASRILSLIRSNGKSNVIRGLKIVKATGPNGVTLEVLITHNEESNADEAFATFKSILYATTPRVTRVVNLLNIGQDKLIEFVPVASGKTNLNEILIVVIVAAVLLVLIASVATFYKVQKGRAQTSPTTTAYDNNGMDKI